jgi:tetratricopeptide (TPR) repeat protein
LLLVILAGACGKHSGKNAPADTTSVSTLQGDKDNWAKEAREQYRQLAYYYNNNIHDTLVMRTPELLEFCREHELWTDYYDTWMLLGQDYSFNGEYDKAIQVVQEIHDDATQRNNMYGLTAAEFIKGLVYDGQANAQEAARSFEAALDNYPANASPFQKNSIYVYYLSELKTLDEAEKMRTTLDEWKAYIDACRKDTTIAPIQFDNWLYYYHHACYVYCMHQKDLDRAAMHVDSVVMHLDHTGWSLVTRNEVMGYRTQLDDRSEKIGKKIREAQVQKVPFMLIVGEKEVESRTVAVRQRHGGDLGAMSLEDFIARMQKDIDAKVND